MTKPYYEDDSVTLYCGGEVFAKAVAGVLDTREAA